MKTKKLLRLTAVVVAVTAMAIDELPHPQTVRFQIITPAEGQACGASIAAECASR